jgi:hypothetical protein
MNIFSSGIRVRNLSAPFSYILFKNHITVLISGIVICWLLWAPNQFNQFHIWTHYFFATNFNITPSASRVHSMPRKKTPWPESANELYRPSDRRLSAKLVPTFADRGCHVVSVTDPYGCILGFLYRLCHVTLNINYLRSRYNKNTYIEWHFIFVIHMVFSTFHIIRKYWNGNFRKQLIRSLLTLLILRTNVLTIFGYPSHTL